MQIRNLTNPINPQSFKIDFEQSMMGASDQVYGVVPQKGYLFHLFENVYKRLQDEGMLQLYMNDEEFCTNIRMISALSFVLISDTIQASFLPIADTIQAFDTQSNHTGNQEQAILDYFESNYIGEL